MLWISRLLGVILIGLFVAGCSGVQRKISNISCQYTFIDIDRLEDQERIDNAIRSVAKGTVVKLGTQTSPIYGFTVASFSDLDKIHPQILYKNSSFSEEANLNQTLNIRSKEFKVSYDSTDISASMEVILRFSVKPGSELFYKDQEGDEINITDKVDPWGNVEFNTKIGKGREYISARTVLGNVTRYIKIDIFTQVVSDIDPERY